MAGGFRESKVNPKFLHSNSTSHTRPFSAIAELIDNAYDASASQIWIDKEVINGRVCLTFVDNGKGMDLDHLHDMLSLGYCEKDKYDTGPASHRLVGQYGIGFKSGSMRLAKDALVLTVQKEADTACVGLLSQTLCSQRNMDTIRLPVMDFKLSNLERSRIVDKDMEEALDAILDVGPYLREEELKEELRKISRQKPGSGTKIVLFNLQRNKNRMLELDFKSDPEDIRNPETQEDDPESSRQQTKVFEYRQSLRRYCSILFLTSKMEIFIRKKRVQTFVINKALSRRRTMKYRPRRKTMKNRPKGKNETEITFGQRARTDEVLEDYGMMLYHRNRLITPYVKLGCQTKEQTDDSHVGEVVGVVDFCDILQPTHNKQEFQVNTVEYRTAMSALTKKLHQYCSQIDHHGDTEDEDRNTRLTWVQCDRCKKWRLIPITVYEPVPNPWYCHMNPDRTKNRCDIQQEESSDEEIDATRTPGSSSKSSSRGRGRGGRRRSRGSTPSSVLHSDSSDSSSDASEQESDCVPATAAPTTSSQSYVSVSVCVSQRPEVASRRKRKQPAHQRTVVDKRARSIRDPDPPLTVDTGVTGHDENDDTGVSGHDEDDDTGVSRHDEDDDTGVSGHDEDDDTGVSGHDEDNDTGVSGHDEDDTGVSGHDENDDTGVSGHDEDDDTGVTRDQAAESNEQLRRFHRFRRNVHTLLRFLVERQTPDLLAVGPLDEIEDYIQRVLTSLLLPLE